MIRAGKLDRKLTIERRTETVDAYGKVSETWATVATVRAECVQTSLEEHMREHGASPEGTVIYRIRYLTGLTLFDRLKEGASILDIKELVEIGRRRGWEIRAVRQS